MEQVQSSGGLLGFFKKFGGEAKPAEPLSGAVIRDWLVRRLAKQLSVPASEIDTSASFASYGLDSLVAVQVSGDRIQQHRRADQPPGGRAAAAGNRLSGRLPCNRHCNDCP